MSEFTVRVATLDDCESLADVQVTAWRESYARILPAVAFEKMNVPERMKIWQQHLAKESSWPVYVAEFDGHPVGFADGGPARDGEALGQEMQLYAIYLRDRAKRQGVGTKLLQRVMDQFLRQGASSACVWTLKEATHARRFYEHHGAQLTAEKIEHRGAYDRCIVGYVWTDLRRRFTLL